MISARRSLLFAFASAMALTGAQAAWAADAAAPAATAAADAGPASQLIVTAPRKEATARAQQLEAPNIINIQSAETIAKYPDFNAAESLGRMPGVSLSIDTGEGRFVTIRGIDSNLDGATFGGVVLLNSYPGGTYFAGSGRAVEFDTVPVGAVDRIEVTKTGLPDHEAEGIGGSVELTPRSARAIEKPFIDLELSGGYENLRDSWAPVNEQVVLGGRFGFGDHGLIIAGHGEEPAARAGFISNPTPFSFVLTQFQHNDRRSIDDFEEAYGVDAPAAVPDKVFDSAEFRRYNYFRRRFGYSGEFDFDPNSDHHYFARVNVAGYTENVNRQRLIYGNLEFDAAGNELQAAGTACPTGDAGPCTYADPNNAAGFFAPAASSTVTLRDQQETHRNTVMAVGGSDRIDGVTIDYQGAYTRATYHKPFDLNWTFTNPNSYGIASDNTNSNFPKFTVESGGNTLDPTLYTLAKLSNSQEADKDEEWSGAGNITIPLHLLSDSDEFKLGAKVRLRDKTVVPFKESYDITTTDTLANFEGGGPYTYYDGLYSIGFRPSGDALKAFLKANLSNTSIFSGGGGLDTGGFYHDTENVFAGYGQFKTTIGGVGILAGVRVESTDATYRAFADVVDASGNETITPIANRESYLKAFPTLQLRYEFRPNLIGRFTYSTGIARPGFSQITAITSVDEGAGSVSTGNPKLRPTYSNNIDLSLEWYLPGAGILSLGAFDKEMSNYVVTRTLNGQQYLSYPGIFSISTYLNVPAYARGIEGQYVQKFIWAPAAFRNFGIDSNVTYVDSQIDLFDNSGSPVKALLPGTSRWTANASLFYEANGLNLRVAAEYVGKNLFTVGGGQTTNNYEDKRLQVDFTSSYEVNRNLTVFFNAKNLNNEPLRFFEGRADRPLQREFYLQTFEFGVRTHFE